MHPGDWFDDGLRTQDGSQVSAAAGGDSGVRTAAEAAEQAGSLQAVAG